MWDRTAVWRMERGPEVNSCSSRTEISYSLSDDTSQIVRHGQLDMGDEMVMI